MSELLLVIYIALPAYVANMMPVLFTRFRIAYALGIPIDRGYTWRGRPLLGANKTWRGVLAAVVGGSVTLLLQYSVLPLTTVAPLVFESALYAVMFGVYVGLLVMVGDALGSIVKRQCDVPSGAPSIPLDQLDYILVFIIGTIPFISWSVTGVLLLLGVTFFLNLGTNALSYVAGIKNTVW